MPAPEDIQTTSGANAGKPEAGDSITFTFAGLVNPDLILSGWDGTPMAVTVHLYDDSNDDFAAVLNASDGSILWDLGAIALNKNYTNRAEADFTNSQMTASGDTVTVVLGTRSGTVHTVHSPSAMTWYTYNGSVTESGPLDIDF
jgi:chitinase